MSSFLINNLVPIIFALLFGVGLRHFLSFNSKKRLENILMPVFGALVFLMGMKFKSSLPDSLSMLDILSKSLMISGLTTIPCFLFLACVFERGSKSVPSSTRVSLRPIQKSLGDILLILSVFLAGALLVILLELDSTGTVVVQIFSDVLLIFLIVLVGVSLRARDFKIFVIRPQYLIIPAIVILGSLSGGCVYSILMGESLNISLALSSGFGWFTLSANMFADAHGAEYGTIALFADLLRELLGIVILCFYGMRYPKSGIGCSGAAALDTSLPVIKNSCRRGVIPIAISSGLSLTIAAPVLMSFFLGRTV